MHRQIVTYFGILNLFCKIITLKYAFYRLDRLINLPTTDIAPLNNKLHIKLVILYEAKSLKLNVTLTTQSHQRALTMSVDNYIFWSNLTRKITLLYNGLCACHELESSNLNFSQLQPLHVFVNWSLQYGIRCTLTCLWIVEQYADSESREACQTVGVKKYYSCPIASSVFLWYITGASMYTLCIHSSSCRYCRHVISIYKK